MLTFVLSFRTGNITTQKILIALTLFAVPLMANAQDTVVLDNGVIRREIVCSGNHIAGKSYVLTATNAQFISGNSPEFYFTVNDVPYSGHSDWKNIKHSETAAADGTKTAVITFDNEKNFSVELTYTVYPALPVVHKSLTIKILTRTPERATSKSKPLMLNIFISTGVIPIRG